MFCGMGEDLPVDAANRQLVGVQGDEIVIVLPRLRMSRSEALSHAAWLAVVADPDGERFAATLKAVRSA